MNSRVTRLVAPQKILYTHVHKEKYLDDEHWVAILATRAHWSDEKTSKVDAGSFGALSSAYV